MNVEKCETFCHNGGIIANIVATATVVQGRKTGINEFRRCLRHHRRRDLDSVQTHGIELRVIIGACLVKLESNDATKQDKVLA